MKIKLTEKATRYIGMSTRARFPSLQWLGTVEVDGRAGQLAFNPETMGYLQLFTSDSYRILDCDEVNMALAQASQAKPGRPVLAQVSQAGTVRLVTMSDAQWEYVKFLGHGNMAAGIRLCVDNYKSKM